MFVMMREAELKAGMIPTNLRQLTPSQVIRMCYGYNNDEVYGRSRMQLYYTIMRWENSFR